jgi:hypothetical protein
MLRKSLPAIVLLAVLSTVSFGQMDNGGGPGGPGGPGGGPPDFAQMRQRMEDRMKQQLDLTDDQWDNLQPKIEKVQQLKRELRVGGPGGPGGPGGFGRGPGGGGGGQGGQDNQGQQNADGNQRGPGGGPGGFGGPPGMDPNSPVQQALSALRDAIQNNAADDTIQSKLATLRKAVADTKDELAAAEKDLTAATTTRQQAVLMTMNILD